MTPGELRRGLLVTLSEVAEKSGLSQSLVTFIEEQPLRDLDVLTLALYIAVALGTTRFSVLKAATGLPVSNAIGCLIATRLDARRTGGAK